MGKLLTFLLMGAGAAYMWRRAQVQRCRQCQGEVRAEASICRYCGERLREAEVIDVIATDGRNGF